MDSSDITREQAAEMGKVISRQLRYLGKPRTRMERRRFPPTDPLYRQVSEAYDKVHRLRMSLHYLTCDPGSVAK